VLIFGEYQQVLGLKRKILGPVGCVKNIKPFGQRLLLPLGPWKLKLLEQKRKSWQMRIKEIRTTVGLALLQ
jgi:hypothetical protein